MHSHTDHGYPSPGFSMRCIACGSMELDCCDGHGGPSDAQRARDAGWTQEGTNEWTRPGTAQDALTLHEANDDSEFGYVLASSPAEALRIDRETFGKKAVA